MKFQSQWPLLALAGAALVAGCQTPQAQETAAAPPTTETAPAQNAAEAPTQEAAPKGPQYRVADKGAGMPADFAAALERVRLIPPETKNAAPETARVVLNTSKGPVTVELNGKAAPMHVRSFLYLADKKFYDGVKFHRHADLTGDGKGFIIQGGDPFSKDPKASKYVGQGGPGYEIPLEADNGLKHEKLVIAAARSQDPDSAGSQFYITQGAVSFLDGNYTVFGKVVAGQEAALKLSQDDTLRSVQIEPAPKKR